jgi:hypothetical protein
MISIVELLRLMKDLKNLLMLGDSLGFSEWIDISLNGGEVLNSLSGHK